MSEKPTKVVDAAFEQLGSPYVFGAWGEFCTPANRGSRVREDHPATKSKCPVLSGKTTSCESCEWYGDRMFDCRGFTHWCLRQVDITLSGQGATSQYNNNDNWLEKGTIDQMPECVCCVFVADGAKKSHTGLYIGCNQTIECSVTVKKQPLSQKWTHYAIPKGLYTEEEIAAIRESHTRPKRTIRRGDRGNDVRVIQEKLNSLGYNCGEADGIFGSKTYNAVKAFQEDHGLTPDGIVGTNTWAALYSGENPKYYNATINHLTYLQISELITRYPDVVVSEAVPEGGEQT